MLKQLQEGLGLSHGPIFMSVRWCIVEAGAAAGVPMGWTVAGIPANLLPVFGFWLQNNNFRGNDDLGDRFATTQGLSFIFNF